MSKTTFRRVNDSGQEVVIPVARLTGARSGPTFAVMSGMHGGEYAGVLAAQRLIQTVDPDDLSGSLIVIPVISTEAFKMRSIQLSPVDGREVHYHIPGNPQGSYSEFLLDCLHSIVVEADYIIDMHAGEFTQALVPWVPVPMVGAPEVQEASESLAKGFDVPYIELRSDMKMIPRLSAFFAESGIANVWVECGQNGIPTPEDVRVQYEGTIAALQTVGMLAGEPARPEQRVLRGQRYGIVADQSGVWRPAVEAGEIVEAGQLLGELTDYFGSVVERFHAPNRSLVLVCTTSPAINHERRPHGYDWHSALLALITVGEAE